MTQLLDYYVNDTRQTETSPAQPVSSHYFVQLDERLLTHPVFRVDIRTVFQQQFDDRFLSIPTGKMKRSQWKLPKIWHRAQLVETGRAET